LYVRPSSDFDNAGADNFHAGKLSARPSRGVCIIKEGLNHLPKKVAECGFDSEYFEHRRGRNAGKVITRVCQHVTKPVSGMR